MISEAHKTLQSLVDLRIEIAMDRLREDAHYKEICEIHAATEAQLVEVFQDSECYFENQSIKEGLEFKEIYVQGLKDGIHLLKFLGVAKLEECL